MPFLESFELDDVLAIRGIYDLASNEDSELLKALMDHPKLRNGITDSQTTLVAAAGTHWDAGEIRRILSPGYVNIEVLSEGTELTPHLKISIVRAGSEPQPATAEIARDAVEFAEGIMQMPLPVGHVIIVLNDKTGNKGYGGTNHGYAFSYLPDAEQKKSVSGKYYFHSGIVHETAHYYWRLGPFWINEGVANTFEYMYGVENEVIPRLLAKATRADCEVTNLKELSSLSPVPGEPQFHCSYYLGQLLFQELLETLGEEEFNERLRQLYQLSLSARAAGGKPGIAEVRQAFHDQSEIVEKHWSGKLNAPENRPWDEDIAHQSHKLIQWDQHPTYDGEFVTLSGTLLGDAVLSSGTIEEANRDGYGNFHIYSVDGSKFTGNISPPGMNRPPRDPGDTTALEFRLEGRTFTVKFRFPQKLGDPSDYIVDVWGFQDESRTPVIWPDRDRLGYARIRVE